MAPCTCQRVWSRLDLCQNDCQQLRQHDRVSFRSLCCGQNPAPRKAVLRHSASPPRVGLGPQGSPAARITDRYPVNTYGRPSSRTLLQRTPISTTFMANISVFNLPGGLIAHPARGGVKAVYEHRQTNAPLTIDHIVNKLSGNLRWRCHRPIQGRQPTSTGQAAREGAHGTAVGG
jgi:hypothetical protein